MRILLLGITLLLGGCATFGQMQDGLEALQGQSLRTAIAALGYPSSESRVAGMRLVVWSNSNSMVMPMAQTASTYGNVYGQYGAASYNQFSTYNTMVPIQGRCQIALQVDDADIIQGYQYNGNMLGCEPYIKSLKRTVLSGR